MSPKLPGRPVASFRPDAGWASVREGRPLPAPCPPSLPELARLAVHAWQQQPGRLANVVAVHGEAAAVAGVCYGHPDPLHQRRQHEEGPAAGGVTWRYVRAAGHGGCRPSSPIPIRRLFPASPDPILLSRETLPLNSRVAG